MVSYKCRDVKRKNKAESPISISSMSLDQFLFILSDQDLHPVYEEFLQQNMAWENLGFYLEVQNFTNLSGDDLLVEAKNIYEKYIEVDSAHELGDITYRLRENIKESLLHPDPHMFDELSEIVVNSLTNSTVTDFLGDSLFIDHVKNRFAATCKSPEQRPFNLLGSIISCIL